MKSFLQGKKALPIEALRPPTGFGHPAAAALVPPRSGAAAGSHSHGGTPSVEVVKEGDKVVRLVVTCACGERVEIDCLYPVGS